MLLSKCLSKPWRKSSSINQSIRANLIHHFMTVTSSTKFSNAPQKFILSQKQSLSVTFFYLSGFVSEDLMSFQQCCYQKVQNWAINLSISRKMLNMNHTVDMLHYSDAKHYSIAMGPPKNFRNFKIQGGPKNGPFWTLITLQCLAVERRMICRV